MWPMWDKFHLKWHLQHVVFLWYSTHHVCIPVYIVIERIVAAKSNQRAEPQPVGKEDLSGSIQPHLTHKDETRQDKYPVWCLWEIFREEETLSLDVFTSHFILRRPDKHIWSLSQVWAVCMLLNLASYLCLLHIKFGLISSILGGFLIIDASVNIPVLSQICRTISLLSIKKYMYMYIFLTKMQEEYILL